MKIINWQQATVAQQKQALARPASSSCVATREQVLQIIKQVQNDGDKALRALTKQYDKVELETLAVSSAEIISAARLITKSAKQAIETAVKKIVTFHQAQYPKNIQVTTSPGVVCEKQFRAIEKVGLYIPGGSAPLVSTVLMLGIPAQLANCSVRILCTPPNRDGNVDPHLLFAAKICGINKIHKVGGAQAIAALAYGTETIAKVNKIFGPGNNWVTQAKQIVATDSQGALLDLPAGPSEVMVIADKTANPKFVASDLLSQLEHGADSQAILISTEQQFIAAVLECFQDYLKTLPRQAIIKQSLKNSVAIVVDDLNTAIAIANHYAPEHLILQIAKASEYKSKIQAAGSVFLGPWSPEAVGDYASGTNHVLPTYGYARSIGGLTVNDFMRNVSFQELTQGGLQKIAATVMTLAELEGLQAHSLAVSTRVGEIK